MSWVRIGAQCPGLELIVPTDKYRPLFLLKGELCGRNGPNEKRTEVFVLDLIPLRCEAMRQAIHVGDAGTRTVIPLVLDVDVFGWSKVSVIGGS